MSAYKSRIVDLTQYHNGYEVTIKRRFNNDRTVEHNYNVSAHSEYRLREVIKEGSADVDLSGGRVDVSVYFTNKIVRLHNYHPPYWEHGWRMGLGGKIVWEKTA